jgi:hypothetical protein
LTMTHPELGELRWWFHALCFYAWAAFEAA